MTPALTLVSAPVAPAESARPTPTAVPRVVPATHAQAEARADPATPESSGDFDTTGEPVTELTNQIPDTNRTAGGVAK